MQMLIPQRDNSRVAFSNPPRVSGYMRSLISPRIIEIEVV